MAPAVLLVAYCALIVAASLAGGALPGWSKLTHARMHVLLSFVAGLMLGVSLFHMLPHAAHYVGSLDTVVGWMVAGLLTMFFLIRAFHFHEHEPVSKERAHRLGWVGVAVGLGLHTAIDGVALSASVVAESADGAPVGGLGTFLAIVLHKPLDAMAIVALMAAGGWAARPRLLVNLGFALMCPLGAVLFYFGVGAEASVPVGCALGFAAGTFLCISLSDLLPEVHFHSHDRVKLSVALLLGIALAWAIGLVEGAEVHGH
ncbi:MAG: ZIP family metal transporter [Planctomycetota bacterium]|jgi:zinc and cadmium transporter